MNKTKKSLIKKKELEKNLNKNKAHYFKIIILLALVCIIGIMLSTSIYFGWYLKEHTTIPIQYSVSNGGVGVLVEKELLHFGKLPRESTATRIVTLKPQEETRVLVKIVDAPDVTALPTQIVMEAQKEYNITFYAQIPANATERNVTGSAKFYFYRQ